MVAVGPAVVGAAGEAGAVVGAWLFSVSSSSLCMASEIEVGTLAKGWGRRLWHIGVG